MAATTDGPTEWPDPDDPGACRSWLRGVWADESFRDAVGLASQSLVERVDKLLAKPHASDREARRATMTTARYLLRAMGRSTPFGTFAGVAPVRAGHDLTLRWGAGHRVAVRADAGWVADVVAQLESDTNLLERLTVVANDLAVGRGDRVQVPHGPRRATVRRTPVVDLVLAAASAPVRFDALADAVTEAWPEVGRDRVTAVLVDLLRNGFLISNLRSPCTDTNPLAHLLRALDDARVEDIAPVRALASQLSAIATGLDAVADRGSSLRAQAHEIRARTTEMRVVSSESRSYLAVDLLLDAEVTVPRPVLDDVERAAHALLRLSRHPDGDPAWQSYHQAFIARYGTGTAVPVLDVIDPDGGIGLPAKYTGSSFPAPAPRVLDRDTRLLELAWTAVQDGRNEVVLADDDIDRIAGEPPPGGRRPGPPHVEIACQVAAPSTNAIAHGEYTLWVRPGRHAGTFSSRFAPALGDMDLAGAYADVPPVVDGALRVQMSFTGATANAENICRIGQHLRHVLPLGEHRPDGPDSQDAQIVPADDLAVTASRGGLWLVSTSRRQVVDPVVFHALALAKQPAPIARFLAELPRASLALWHGFDWGPAASQLAWLPRVRYGRTVLCPARWRLTTEAVAAGPQGPAAWDSALARWRDRWRCPHLVELHTDDQPLSFFNRSSSTRRAESGRDIAA